MQKIEFDNFHETTVWNEHEKLWRQEGEKILRLKILFKEMQVLLERPKIRCFIDQIVNYVLKESLNLVRYGYNIIIHRYKQREER
jgi:hypothetical protein